MRYRSELKKLWQLLCVILLILGRFVTFAIPWFLAKLVSVFEDGALPALALSGRLRMSALRDVCSTCLRLFRTPFISISSVGSLGPEDAILGSW